MHIYADFMIALLCAVEFEVRVCFSMLVIPSKDKVSVRWCGTFSENTVCAVLGVIFWVVIGHTLVVWF